MDKFVTCCAEKLKCRLAVAPPQELLAEIVASNSPGVAGVPEMTPVAGSTLKAGGRLRPPNKVGDSVAVMLYLKLAPCEPEAKEGLVIVGIEDAMVRSSVTLSEAQAFNAIKVGWKFPYDWGIPEIIPFVGSTESPAGKWTASKLVGLWRPVIV